MKAVLGLSGLALLVLSCGADGEALFDDPIGGRGGGATAGADGSAGRGATSGSSNGEGGVGAVDHGGSTAGGSAGRETGGGSSVSGSGGNGGEAGDRGEGDAGSGGEAGESGAGGGGPTQPEAIYVSSAGDDAEGCGLEPIAPCKTISRGVERGIEAVRSAIHVQAGTYPGVVVLKSGVSVIGGFDQDWVRGSRDDSEHQTVIEGGVDPASQEALGVWAENLTQPASLENLLIVAPRAEGQRTGGLDGRSSYGVRAVSAKLRLEDVTIRAGDGAPGVDGAAGQDAVSTAAVAAMNGKVGGNGTNTGMGSACNVSTSPGGGAGTNTCEASPSSVALNGGKGGFGGPRDKSCASSSTQLDDTAQPGGKGEDAASVIGSAGLGGDAGSGGTECSVPKSGNPGAIRNGAGGTQAAATPALFDHFLYARAGGAGSTGQNGSGGGGGGGSGGCDKFPNDARGAGGGGGGAGGCAARAGGGGGGGGGSSVGIFAVDSTLELSNVSIELGAAAAGGKGGAGGQGQSGGQGNIGGSHPETAEPGRGGNGAHGGHGGGGAGGNGGSAIGVYAQGTLVTGTPTVSGGVAGKGGAGGASAPNAPLGERDGNAGEPGAAGSVIATQSE